MSLSVTCLVVLLTFVGLSTVQVEGQDQANGADLLGLSVAQIAQLRKYYSEEHYVTTADGYILQVTRILNPLIKDYSRKRPVLLIHGLIQYGSSFVFNSVDARPRDYSWLNAAEMSSPQLEALLANDPSSKSIAFLASNFGHEVWILNRRGTPGSRGHVNTNSTKSAFYSPLQVSTILSALGNLIGAAGTTISTLLTLIGTTLPGAQAVISGSAMSNFGFDPDYWNYSLDEQAMYDIPAVIDHVLQVTNHTQLDVIGHSFGGALILMGLITNPELNTKIANPILWSPALYVDIKTSNPLVYTFLAAVSPILQSLLGPFFPEPINELFVAGAGLLSPTQLSAQLLVAPIFSVIMGPGLDQQYITSGLFDFVITTVSAHEFHQLYQIEAVGNGRMHTYDFGSASANLAAYGSPNPILYNVSRITNPNLNFWYGGTDAIVGPENRQRLYQDLVVPYTANLIGGPGLYFNHQQFFTHINVAKLLNIPTLRIIN